jgi:anti-sigma B factor antagonist
VKFEITKREKEGVAILDASGKLIAGESAALLRETFSTTLATGSKKVILNLADVDYIDSTGLGALVMCHTKAEDLQGMVKLLNLTKRNIELLVLTKLTTIFDIHTDEQEAVNSFFPDRKIERFDILNFLTRNKGQ